MSNWQQELSNGFKDVHELLRFLNIPEDFGSSQSQKLFKTRVPRGFAARMQKGYRDDPLLKQVMAIDDELMSDNDYVQDPLQESQFHPIPGLIHKYHNRVLWMLSGACAVNCRYCFRRHFPYAQHQTGRLGWQDILAYIAKHPEIDEVIFSGGDPLVASNDYFAELLKALHTIPHIQHVRIHSRLPIVLPSRIESSWLALWDAYPWQKVMVVHCNHPQELDESVVCAIAKLKQKGWTVFNQSVILKGVNDNVDILIQLSHRLFAIGILPYYLHVLDKVEGAQHFDVPLVEIFEIYQQLQRRLSGYLLPRLAQEIPGVPHKTLLKTETNEL